MQCHILYISASESDDMAALADSARAAGVLTIADTRGAARKGVMLELVLDDRRIAFEFNGAAARGAGVVLSSKVLRLARAIY
jgi:CelD/BcsL family acetyltransferase involved in cellulose biosynthesis